MQIDIPAHIEKLLFLHDALVIPGFGGFTTTRTPASTDYVSGLVTPPAKALSFSENLTVDDGLLTADIADAHSLSLEDARRTVEEFVEKMRDLLDQREIVTLPGVGRLYKNYVQKIQFLPDATNFNAASYGLPPLQFSPIARSREVEKTQEPSTASTPPAVAPQQPASTPPAPVPSMPEQTFNPERARGGSKFATALGIFLLLAGMTAGIWYWRNKEKVNDLPDQTELVTENSSGENVAPDNKTAPAEPKEENSAETTSVTTQQSAEAAIEARENEAREKVNLARNGRECILIVATLSDKTNVEKLRRLLKEEGYEEYYVAKGNSHMVGIRFHYLKSAEIEEKRTALKALTGVGFIAVKKK